MKSLFSQISRTKYLKITVYIWRILAILYGKRACSRRNIPFHFCHIFFKLNLFHHCSALFIIDGRGVLRQITMNDLPVGRSVDETLRLVQAFQYTDEHGEVCPAGWKPGQDTVSQSPYFSLLSRRLIKYAVFKEKLT